MINDAFMLYPIKGAVTFTSSAKFKERNRVSGSCVGCQWRDKKISDFIKNIFIYVPKINGFGKSN